MRDPEGKSFTAAVTVDGDAVTARVTVRSAELR